MTLPESWSVPVPHRPLVAVAGLGAEPTVVWLRGEYDLSTMAALTEMLAGAMTQHDGDLVLDLSEVQFMDATTIGVIIRARNHLRGRSRSLALRSPPAWARRVLDQCDLAGLIGLDPATPKHPVADPLGYGVTAEMRLSAPAADLLVAQHQTAVARRREP